MEGTLSKALQKYYTRKGNRIIFSNGMTLNQLAWEMWERLGYESVDPSVLSRVINGERIFTSRQLDRFISILKLKNSEAEILKETFLRDLEERYGIGGIFADLKNKYLIEFVKDGLEKIRGAYWRGASLLADEWVDQLIDRISGEKSLVNYSNKREIFKIKSELLIEKVHLNFQTKPKDVLIRDNLKIYGELTKINNMLKNKNLSLQANYVLGDTYRKMGRHRKATKYLKTVVDEKMPERERLYSIRSLAISLSCLGYIHEYKAMKKYIMKNISQSSINTWYQLYESIARSETRFRNQKGAQQALHSARQYLQSPYNNSQKELQAIVGEVEMGIEFDEPKDYLERLCKRGLEMARGIGHIRYENGFNTCLNEGFNKSFYVS